MVRVVRAPVNGSMGNNPDENIDRAPTKSLGIAACTALVIGNMVGSGFYLSPAVLAPYGNLAILAWVIMGAGAICVGLTFAKLARLAPATGGPYAYSRMAYGDFAGFLIAWGLWISMWSSLPVIAIAFAGATIDLFPSLHNRPAAVTLTLTAIWAVVLINLRGVKEAGLFSQVTTFTKLIPFGAVALIGLFFVDASNFSEFNPSGKSIFTSVAALAPVTMFAFLGLESATIPAGDVINPKRTIPLSTVLGITIAAVLYVCGTIAVMGLVPREQLVHSVAPFSDAARTLWGDWGAAAISLAVILSAIGALNGWTLLMGQVPMAAARDNLFPATFGHLSRRGVPATGIIISAILATLLVLSQVAGPPGFKSFYDLVVGLSTMAAVIPYAFCALATGLVAAQVAGGGPVPRLGLIEVIAFIFSVFILYGCGAKPVLFGTIMLVLGIPIYVWQQRRRSQIGLNGASRVRR
jgi:APA family basic amino acid/polyamine antiporter